VKEWQTLVSFAICTTRHRSIVSLFHVVEDDAAREIAAVGKDAAIGLFGVA
jgi:hypothetical protein